MSELIITTTEQLREVIQECLNSVFEKWTPQFEEHDTDNISLIDAIELLNSNGYKISKSKLYKLTSANSIPYFKFGNKLMFSKEDLLA